MEQTVQPDSIPDDKDKVHEHIMQPVIKSDFSEIYAEELRGTLILN